MNITEQIQLVSDSLDPERAERIIEETDPFLPDQHLEYPSDSDGPQVHLEEYFSADALLRKPKVVEWLASDLKEWLKSLDTEIDVVFAPDTESVRTFVSELSSQNGFLPVYLETQPSARFGSQVRGSVPDGANVLTFNMASLTGGRCIGFRLPEFAEKEGGQVQAAAAIVLGTSPLNEQLNERFPDNVYVTFHVDVTHHKPDKCPDDAPPLRPWQEANQEILAGEE